MNTISKHNKSLHLTAIPLRFIAADELGRYAALCGISIADITIEEL